MRAAVFYAPGDVRVEERPDPAPGPHDVVLRVGACGICGTDRHIFHGEFATTPPVIIGHEYAGEVVAVGDEVTRLSAGDRVAIDPNMYCGTCRSCRRGKLQSCENLTALGVDVDGGFAQFCCAPEAQCFPLPDQVSTLAGAMIEPLACCVHGIDLAGVTAGDIVAVIGAGAIGLLLAQLARNAGASQILVSDPNPVRRGLAQELGFDDVIDPFSQDPLASGGALPDGADVVIEAVGSTATTAQAVSWAARGAMILWFGVTPPGQTVPIEPNELFQKELTIRGARINPFTHSRAIDLIASGRVVVEPLITQRVGLDDLPQVLAAPAGDHTKTVVQPW